MKRTPEQFRRAGVRSLLEDILPGERMILSPKSIDIGESIDEKLTSVSFSFLQEQSDFKKLVQVKGTGSSGFVDGLFLGLYSNYVDEYNSLRKLKLVDLMVNPIMRTSASMGSDAQARVTFRLEVEGHGVSEFQHQSRSVIHSSFIAALGAFQFYMNCERAFRKMQGLAADATARNRGDILQDCMNKLSKLTEVNTYGK
jgi:hypothetical protein